MTQNKAQLSQQPGLVIYSPGSLFISTDGICICSFLIDFTDI